MSTRIKWNGQWLNLDLKNGNVAIADFIIGNYDNPWKEIQPNLEYTCSISISEMSSDCHAICFVEGTEEVITSIECLNGQIKFIAQKAEQVSGFILYSSSNSFLNNQIFLLGGISNSELERLIPIIAEKLHISIKTIFIDDLEQSREVIEFSGVRQVEEASFTKESATDEEKQYWKENKSKDIENKITIGYKLEGESIEDSIKIDTIYLDTNDYPICGKTNGIDWIITWQGFGGE